MEVGESFNESKRDNSCPKESTVCDVSVSTLKSLSEAAEQLKRSPLFHKEASYPILHPEKRSTSTMLAVAEPAYNAITPARSYSELSTQAQIASQPQMAIYGLDSTNRTANLGEQSFVTSDGLTLGYIATQDNAIIPPSRPYTKVSTETHTQLSNAQSYQKSDFIMSNLVGHTSDKQMKSSSKERGTVTDNQFSNISQYEIANSGIIGKIGKHNENEDDDVDDDDDDDDDDYDDDEDEDDEDEDDDNEEDEDYDDDDDEDYDDDDGDDDDDNDEEEEGCENVNNGNDVNNVNVDLGDNFNDDDDDSSEEEDVHVCGRCKQIFHTLNEYMAHKSSKVCKSSKSSLKDTTSISPVIPISKGISETLIENRAVNSQKTLESNKKFSLVGLKFKEKPSKEIISLDNASMLETTVKSVINISNQSLCDNKGDKLSVTSDNHVPNQDILETAAKNTIFRDAFIPLDDTTSMREITEEEAADFTQVLSPSSVSPGVTKTEDSGEKEKTLVMVKMEVSTGMQVVKRKRGRPPKSAYEQPSNVSTSIVTSTEDSPPKAKRKSRPPRRHKPDEDLSEIPLDLTLEEETLESQFPILNGNVVPTVENIQKLFSNGSNRGKGRGKRRGPHPLHRCPICQLLFPSRITMIEHKRKHSKLFRCKICNEGFYTEDKLEKHLSKETHNYPCDSCERILINKQALVRHKMSHSDKLFKCDLCARAFKSARDLKNHTIGMHSETRDFICQVCNKAFTRREKLKRHLMIHAPDRPVFTCPFKNHVGCDKTFYRKDKLTRHLYSHSKVKPFKCDQCDKSFARTDNLREHIRSHTGVFRYYCTVCGKGQPGPKKFLKHMLKQHNIDNADIPKPFEELAPEPLIQQHKAVVQAETAAKLARAASNLKKEREKSGHKMHKDDIENQELHLESHVTLATMNNIGLHAMNASSLLTSPTSQTTSTEQQIQSRANVGSIYTINQHADTSPQFQISRHVPEGMVRHISESMLRENLTREGLSRDSSLRESISHESMSTQPSIARHLNENGEVRLQEGLGRHHIVQSPHITSETLRRQIGETTVAPGREVQEVQQQTLSQAVMVEAEGNIPVSQRGLQLLSHGVLPGNLQFTTLLNSDLVAIGEAVIRNQNGISTVFQQKFGPPQQ